jgi:RNA polymerase sigma-70 factor, ECF subfamily
MTLAFATWIAAGGEDSPGDLPVRGRAKTVVQSRQPSIAPDAAVIALISAGDERAFSSLYHEHARAIATYVMTVTHSASDAQDVVQEAYLALWNRRATLAPTDHLLGFLYRTARNIALTRARHDTVISRAEDDARTTSDIPLGVGKMPGPPDEPLEEEERHRHLARALGELTERHRLAIQLRFYEELSYAAIGEVLGVSENAAFMLVSRAIAALRPAALAFLDSA